VAALAALAIRRSPIGRIGPALSCFVVLLLVVRSDVSDGADCSTGAAVTQLQTPADVRYAMAASP
jgi:hypothetical protein